MLTSLSSSQIARFSEYRQKWLDIGFDCSPLDLEKAKIAVASIYRAAKLPIPKFYFVMGSPYSAAIAEYYLKQIFNNAQISDKVRNQVSDQVWNQVSDQVRAQVWNQVSDKVSDQVSAEVSAQVRNLVWNQVSDEVRVSDQVSDQVRNQVRNQVSDQVNDQVWNQVRNQVWAQVRAQVSDQVRAQVWNQVWNQVSAEVSDKVSDQVSAEVRNQVSDQVWNQVSDQVSAEVSDQARAQVWAQVRTQVWAQVRNQVWAQVRDQVSAEVSDQVRNQVSDEVWAQVSAEVWAEVRVEDDLSINSQIYGSHESWLSFYDYFLNECSFECCKPLEGLIDLAHHCGWWSPFTDFVILQDRHCELHRDSNGSLHHSSEMSIKYRDGWGFYCLHGVRVPDWLVTTRTEDIDPHLLHKLDNAQVRAEFVRKVGIDRCFYKLGKVVDRIGNYELGMLELGDGRTRPYLKMLNPSVPDLWHVEGVHPDCNTVERALNWRNGTSKVPEILT